MALKNKSDISIQITWSVLTNKRPVLPDVHVEVVSDLAENHVEGGAVFGPLCPVIGDQMRVSVPDLDNQSEVSTGSDQPIRGKHYLVLGEARVFQL